MQKGDAWAEFLLLIVLAFAIVIVDERFLRTGIAFVPGLLLFQRAVVAKRAEATLSAEPRVGAAERRLDDVTRSSIDKLLWHIREFYLVCHMTGTGQISPDEAVEKASEMERDLNKLLARVTDSARSGTGVKA